MLQAARVVVEGDRSRVGDAEGIQGVGERDLLQALADVERVHLVEGALLEHTVVGDGVERVVVGDQRMHAVDADELLGERVGNAAELLLRPRNAVEDLKARATAEGLVEAFAEEAEPVCAQCAHRRRVGDDRRRPVDRMDLGHERGVDQARLLVKGLVVELRVLGVQPLADRVVLEHEERVQQCEADPEVAGDAAKVDVRLHILGQQPFGRDPQQTVFPGADRAREGWVAAVDLRAVPPVRVGGDECRGTGRIGARILARPLDLHRVLRPWIVRREVDAPRVLGLVLAVAEPVMHLELDPGAGEQVEGRRRDELLACQELEADPPRVGLEQTVVRIGKGMLGRDVATEAAAEPSHQRILEVVVRAVDRAGGQVVGVPLVAGGRHVQRPAAGVVQVLRA